MIDVNVTTITGESVNTIGTYYPLVETLNATTTVSTPPAGLMFHSRLDNIVEGKVIDTSGNSYNGTVSGTPEVVPDDNFGSCLNFAGENQYIDLPTDSLPTGNEITVSFWTWGSDSIPKYNSILWGDENGNRVINVHLGWTDNKVYFDCGLVSTSYDRISKTASLEKLKGSWRHWVFTKNATNGTMKIYLDGELWHSDSSLTRSLPAADLFRFGSSNSTDRTYMGKVSNLRIYDRELSQDEIKYDIAGDITSMARFRMAHPLDFRLLDDNARHVIYIDDSGQSHNLNFEIVNTSGETVTIPEGIGTASADNYHFELRFRPATLSNATIIDLQSADTAGINWSLDYVHNTDGTDSLYLLNSTALPLNSGDKLKITLSGISAEPGKGARGTRVETRYSNITYRGETISGYLEEHISIINHSGLQYLPLHTGFHSGDRVMNEGGQTNTLLLRLTNAIRPDAAYPERAKIKLNGISSTEPSKLILSFDTEADGESKDWALGTTSQVNGISVKVKKESSTGGLLDDTEWTVTKTITGNNPQWDIAHNTGKTIYPGTHITLELSGIVTSHPVGLTNLYLHYENIPGYWDGQLVCPIEKSPIMFKDGKMGIGVSDPSVKLQLVNNPHNDYIDTLILGPMDSTNLRLGYASMYTWVQSHNLKPLLLNAWGNNVGVGTTDPLETLHVDGNILLGASSKPYYLKAGRNSDPSIVSTATSWLRLGANQGIAFWANNEVDQNENPQFFIKDNGRVGIGTTNPDAQLHIVDKDSSTNSIKIEGINRNWIMEVDSSSEGLYFSTGVTSLAQTIAAVLSPSGVLSALSDLTLKDDVKSIGSILEKVLKLKPISFIWKKDPDGKREIGFGAQDVEKLFPDMVEEQRGIKTLRYQDFSVLAIAAIQEQQTKIDELEKKLAELTQKVEALSS